ncbi:MAG: hypothetical protein M3619_29535, partial [Myxococcota bacterium]|nr:hypothetical protein [Myxococcota bacterium]
MKLQNIRLENTTSRDCRYARASSSFEAARHGTRTAARAREGLATCFAFITSCTLSPDAIIPWRRPQVNTGDSREAGIASAGAAAPAPA